MANRFSNSGCRTWRAGQLAKAAAHPTATQPFAYRPQLLCVDACLLGPGSLLAPPMITHRPHHSPPRLPLACAVSAVTAVVAYTPLAMHVLMSACTPAPPPLSLPAMASTRGTCRARGEQQGDSSVEAHRIAQQP